MNLLIDKLNEGGPIFTYPILIFLLIILALIAKELIKQGNTNKANSLIANIAWFAVAWGFLGRTFGLIVAFDNIAAADGISPAIMAGGLKMAILAPLMGIVVFLIARLGIIILSLMQKED